MNIFVDTGAFYALADKRDKHHKQAKQFYIKHFKSGLFVTSNFVFLESWTLIHHKLGKRAARTFWETIRSGVIYVRNITNLDLENAWEIFNKYKDQDFSLVDCTSFAMMERLKIYEVFTFDVHFSVFRTKSKLSLKCIP
jgi:predicted nucleic acid-binding protein